MNMQNRQEKIRVRFAPSPTGLLHVGSFRTALFNWLFARRNGGEFILRIEDTDRKRSTDEFLTSQLADMKWMGLNWDEGPEKGGKYGPYFQTERLNLYREHAERLLAEGKAYYCYCTPEELSTHRKKAEEEQENGNFGYSGRCRNLSPQQKNLFITQGRKPCIRFRIPENGNTEFNDMIRGDMSFENRLMEDFVIVKSDGIPTYNFAVVVDDHLMEITHVIRGDEHLSNTPRQVLLYRAFGYPLPRFAHIPIILNQDRTKLSKRKGAVHLLQFREMGFLKEALLNFLALLGWAPKDDREILNAEELMESFSLDGVTNHPAIFDETKLEWMNGQYMALLPVETVAGLLIPYLEKIGADPGIKSREWLISAVGLYRDRAKTMVELANSLEYYFKDFEEYDPDGVKKNFKHDFLPDALNELSLRIQKDDRFTPESLEEILRNYAGEIGVSAGKIIHGVRLAITGRTGSPPIFDVMWLTGRETLINRLHRAVNFMRDGNHALKGCLS